MLNLTGASMVTPWFRSAASCEGTQTGVSGVAGSLADLGDYISRFSMSAAKSKSLWIHIRCDAIAVVAVFSNKHGSQALVFSDSGKEQAVRSVLANFGIYPIQDYSLPNNVRGLFCRLSSVFDLGQFLRELLTKGFSVTPDAPLEFDFREKNPA